MKKLAIITTHPIQYYAPLFRLLHQRKQIAIKVFYTWGEASLTKHDPGFGKQIIWDIDLLDGYGYEWANNTSVDPGTHHFKGIITPGLIQQINNYQPDGILVFGWAFQSHLKVLRYFNNKIPVYFRGDSTLLDDRGGIKSVLRGLFLKWVYSHVDHAFYVGSANKAYFKRSDLSDRQLSFAPHAVDNERFATSCHEEAIALRQKLNISAENILILFAGKLEEKKAPQLLLQAFLHISDPRLHLLFVGNGELEQQLKTKANAHHHVHFMDLVNQSEMPVVYQACEVFCLPSKGPGETWGLAVNEAMACGKAIIVSDRVGCAADLVGPENGAIFKSDNVEALISVIKEVTRSKAHTTEMGRRSARKIASWSLDTVARMIENKLLNRGDQL